MKYLNWIKNNINTLSFIAGIGFVIMGRNDVGSILIRGVVL